MFCRRDGERSGPVKNGDAIVCVSTRSLAIVPVPPAVPPTRPVTYDGAALLPLLNPPVGAGRGTRTERRGREPGEHAGDDVAGGVVTGPAAERCRPCFVVPRDDRPIGGHTGALIDRVRHAVVLPGHFVLARQLDPHRLANRLRQQRRIERHGVGAVDPVAAGTAGKHDPDVVERNPEQHRHAAAGRIGRLRGRPDGGAIATDVGHRARRPHRPVHLIRIPVGKTTTC